MSAHLKITSHHKTVADAVATAKPDLSYNEQSARETIAAIDRHATQAMVMENGEIYYVFAADINLLNKFEPFSAGLSDSPFQVAFIVGNTLLITDTKIQKTKAGRAWFKSNKLGALAA